MSKYQKIAEKYYSEIPHNRFDKERRLSKIERMRLLLEQEFGPDTDVEERVPKFESVKKELTYVSDASSTELVGCVVEAEVDFERIKELQHIVKLNRLSSVEISDFEITAPIRSVKLVDEDTGELGPNYYQKLFSIKIFDNSAYICGNSQYNPEACFDARIL